MSDLFKPSHTHELSWGLLGRHKFDEAFLSHFLLFSQTSGSEVPEAARQDSKYLKKSYFLRISPNLSHQSDLRKNHLTVS